MNKSINNNIVAVVLCGGSGNRLWPVSRKHHPKQFHPILGKKSMIQETLLRLNGLNLKKILLVCNEENKFLAKKETNTIKVPFEIILEPEGKNTAPAIALAALSCDQKDIMAVFSADHFIEDSSYLHKSISKSIKLAEQGKIVTLGVEPAWPSTEYGYVRKEKKITDKNNKYQKEKFIEKPLKNLADRIYASKNYLWNCGIFIFKSSTYMEELKKYNKDILQSCIKSTEEARLTPPFIHIDESFFKNCPSESIDYCILEKTKNLFVIKLNTNWSDLGTWNSVKMHLDKDSSDNSFLGNVVNIDSENCYIASDSRLITAIDLQDLIIVDTKDALLISSLEGTKKIKSLVKKLRKSHKDEVDIHTEVLRPWGKFISLNKSKGFHLKKISVNSGASISLQKHIHRSEHWVVLSGIAEVTLAEKKFLLNENESTYIPKGAIHRLKNIGNDTLEIIEVQTGNYLGEDDIKRLEDDYERTLNS